MKYGPVARKFLSCTEMTDRQAPKNLSKSQPAEQQVKFSKSLFSPCKLLYALWNMLEVWLICWRLTCWVLMTEKLTLILILAMIFLFSNVACPCKVDVSGKLPREILFGKNNHFQIHTFKYTAKTAYALLVYLCLFSTECFTAWTFHVF